jgi:hypothetical protein
MDKEPKSEKIIEKKEVVEMLKTNGFDHPETRELLGKWHLQRKVEIDGSENPGRDEIILNIEISDLYLDAGKTEEAFTNLEEALEQADLQNDIVLQDRIVAKLKAIKAQKNN